MNLPVVYQPNVGAEGNSTLRFMSQALDAWSKTKKPGVSDLDEYADFCRSVDRLPPRS